MEVVSFEQLGITLNISRVAFTIFGFNVYWYGILIGTGLLLAVLYAFKRSDEFGLDSDRMLDVIIGGVFISVIGARLYYCIFAEPGTFNSILDWFNIRNGGLAFYGGLIGAVVSCLVICPMRKVKLLPMADVLGIGFLIGQGIGRWGNFFNQEAFGCNTTLPWGMSSRTITTYLAANMSVIESHGMTVNPFMPVHPTFLYESVWYIVGAVLLSLYVKHRKFDGEIFLMYLAWNGAGRAIVEGLRTDSLYIGAVRVSQLIAVVICVFSICGIVYVRNLMKKNDDPDFLKPYGMTEAWQIQKAEFAALAAENTKIESDEVLNSSVPAEESETDSGSEPADDFDVIDADSSDDESATEPSDDITLEISTEASGDAMSSDNDVVETDTDIEETDSSDEYKAEDTCDVIDDSSETNTAEAENSSDITNNSSEVSESSDPFVSIPTENGDPDDSEPDTSEGSNHSSISMYYKLKFNL